MVYINTSIFINLLQIQFIRLLKDKSMENIWFVYSRACDKDSRIVHINTKTISVKRDIFIFILIFIIQLLFVHHR